MTRDERTLIATGISIRDSSDVRDLLAAVTLTEASEVAQVVIALGTTGGFLIAWMSARRARDAAHDSRRSAQAAHALVAAERERLEVELKPRVTLGPCYFAKGAKWIVPVTNRGPRDIDELTVEIAPDDLAVKGILGTVHEGDVEPYPVDRLQYADQDGDILEGPGSKSEILRDMYAGETQYLRVSRANLKPQDAVFILNYKCRTGQDTQHDEEKSRVSERRRCRMPDATGR